MAARGWEPSDNAPPVRSGDPDRERAERLVLELIGSQADSLLRVARRYSLCPDDAHDAYQRGLEILLRHAERLDPDRAAGWLHTVVKHEAMAINRSRRRILGAGDVDLDAMAARDADSPEDRALAADRVARSAEALHGLKAQEVRALWLKALGHSYEQIAEATGWSYTKVNRSLAEGRKRFLSRYAGIESGAECERLAAALSAFADGEANAGLVVEVRNHLRRCSACRATLRGLHETAEPLTVVFPAAGAVAATGGIDHAGSFFVRVYETVTMHLNERAANSLLRAQAIIDTATAGKMAAAAASAAAVAGGGLAAERVLHGGAVERPGAIAGRVESASVAPPVSRPRAKAAPRFVTARRSSRKAPRRRATATIRRAKTRRTTVASTPKPAPARTSAPAPTPAAPASQPAPKPVVTVASASSGGGGSAAGEFGFEGP
jgi:RNA polymerase sigma factor (sigma-70 family)